MLVLYIIIGVIILGLVLVFTLSRRYKNNEEVMSYELQGGENSTYSITYVMQVPISDTIEYSLSDDSDVSSNEINSQVKYLVKRLVESNRVNEIEIFENLQFIILLAWCRLKYHRVNPNYSNIVVEGDLNKTVIYDNDNQSSSPSPVV